MVFQFHPQVFVDKNVENQSEYVQVGSNFLVEKEMHSKVHSFLKECCAQS
jgi:hypothetical protein